jgi:phosphoribosylformylglycinamidine synthase
MPLVRVTVKLKPSLLDSAGRTVADRLKSLNYAEVADVRIGKVIDVEVNEVDSERVDEMCRKLLSNPVIEDFSWEEVD